MREVPYPHPGEILLHEFLEPMGLTHDHLARAIGVPPKFISEVIQGKRALDVATSLRLSRFFRMSKTFWVGLQLDHDLATARCARRHPAEDSARGSLPVKGRTSPRPSGTHRSGSQGC